MPELLTVSAAGARIGIDLTALDPQTAAAVRAVWRDAVTDGAPDDVVVPRAGQSVEALLSGLSQQVTLSAIDAGRGRGWMLHAAGVANDRGGVVVLVGPSGRGKTTASRTLGRHFGYVSDETIAIEADGTVHEYRKPLSIIQDWSTPKAQVAPSDLGLLPLPHSALRVAAVALLDRRPEHEGRPRLELLDLGDALAELVAQSSHLASHASPLREITGIVGATGGVRRIVYREAEDLVETIAELAAAEGGAAVPLEPLAFAPSRTPTDGATPRFTRANATDAVALDGPQRIAIMTVDEYGRGTVHIIAGVAPAVWLAASGATLLELREAAVEAYGHPPGSGGEAAVRAVVAALLDEGLLESDEPRFQRAGDAAVDREDAVIGLPLDGSLGQPTLPSGSDALIWEWLKAPLTATQLFGRAVAAGAPQSDEAWVEIEGFLDELVSSGLVSENRR